MYNYVIKMIDINKNNIGFICFNFNDKTNKIYISYLNVNKNYRNKGYGTLLILVSIKHIINNVYNSYFIKEIKLVDCSSNSGQTNSIYYKLGFRNYDINNEEDLFVKFFKKNKLNIKTIYDLYDYIYDNNYNKLNKLNFSNILFKINIYHNNELTKNYFNFNLDKKINKKMKITRKNKL